MIDEEKEKDPIIGVLTFNVQTILRMLAEKPQVNWHTSKESIIVNCLYIGRSCSDSIRHYLPAVGPGEDQIDSDSDCNGQDI